MDNGWIKLHRKIMQKGYYKKSHYVHLWVHLLLKANHKDKEFMFNNEIIIIKKGQLLTGRKQLASETGMNESKAERILKMLENEQQIEQQKTTKFRIITVKNWENYQLENQSEQQNEQQVNNKRTTSEQQVNTNKNVKNVKNVKNKEGKPIMEQSEELADELKMYLGEYPKEMLEAFYLYWTEPNKSKTKIKKEMQSTWDTKRRLSTWSRNNKNWSKDGTPKSIFESDEFRRKAERIAESIANDNDLE